MKSAYKRNTRMHMFIAALLTTVTTWNQPRFQTTDKQRKKIQYSQALVAPACHPSYSGGRDQEDRGSRQLQASNC
jgi:hypothetical protein